MTAPGPDIHPTAVIAKGAKIGAGCVVGPYCVIGAEVVLGEGCHLKSHVVIDGQTTLGPGNRIWSFASLGSQPQDLKYHGEKSQLVIGARNQIREYVTMNPGTEGGGGVTNIADDNLFMVHAHVAHDCQIGNNIVFANAVAVAGHAIVGDNAVIGGLAGIHQFCRIGAGAMIGAGAIVVHDVIPYGSVTSQRGSLAGLNLVGLRRRKIDKPQLNGLRAAYKSLFHGEGTLGARAQALVRSEPDNPLVMEMLDFVLSASDRSFCTPD